MNASHLLKILFGACLVPFILVNCKTSSPEPFTGYHYDPENVTDTHDRDITRQNKRTIGFMNDGVWISNEFDAARANDVTRLGKHQYKIEIQPEIKPINNSPWYGFYIWADDSVQVTLELETPEGRQRYVPKISRDMGKTWAVADDSLYSINRETNRGILKLDVTPEFTWISAQEVYATEHLSSWLDDMSQRPFVQQRVAGYSHDGRPVPLLTFTQYSEKSMKGVIIVYNRQHPPEVPGHLAGLIFLETLAGQSDLARQFRSYFDVWAFPMINPDGVDNGHWRTNAAGVDLNRDWEFFRQPETAAVRRALAPLLQRKDRNVFYGIDFHSTRRNLFYPIKESIQTFPHRFTYRWAEAISDELPWLNLGLEPFDVDSPIAKNWTYKTFGSDAVTFEVADELPREQLEEFAVKSAEIFMKLMIEAYHAEYDP